MDCPVDEAIISKESDSCPAVEIGGDTINEQKKVAAQALCPVGHRNPHFPPARTPRPPSLAGYGLLECFLSSSKLLH